MTATDQKLVTLQIDDKEVSVPAGTLLWHAARSVGVDIPIFCYHAKMPPLGACRMCLVEIEKMPKLQTACTTPVADGMIVRTTSEKTQAAQDSVLEFLLINHPLDCPICDKGGECPLQDQTYKWGPASSRFQEPKMKWPKPLPLSENILLDRERCIMCFRCVRFQSELADDESLTVLNRGTRSEIGLAPGRTFDSPFSGNTIELCPVGALTSARYRFRSRPWDLKVTPSVCGLCSVGCNVALSVRKENDVLTRVTSRENLAVDDGWLCDRGRFGYDFANSEDRIATPMIRREGELQPATYEEALAEAARLITTASRAARSAVSLPPARQTRSCTYSASSFERR
ncbi:MAG: 2Fe-2S iron-sulfur cluster-binding protein [Chloroflexia bacterium]